MDSLKCVGLQFSMFFDSYPEIRMQSNVIEKELKQIFSDGLITLPDQGPAAPNEIPRILGSSHDGVYQLSISNVNSSFSKVKFSSNEQIETVLEDFKLKLDSVYAVLINTLPNQKLTFCGLTIFINVSDKNDVNQFMLKRFFNEKPLSQIAKGLEIYDVGTKYTFTSKWIGDHI